MNSKMLYWNKIQVKFEYEISEVCRLMQFFSFDFIVAKALGWFFPIT
jgi:hypothetical protein